MTLPNDRNARKNIPLHDFLVGYFPDAIAELVRVSVAGNAQHNPGEKLHWARHKSTDQLNTAVRHIFDHTAAGMYDQEPPEVQAAIDWEGEGHQTMHLAKAAWRLLAEIQLLCEKRASAAADKRLFDAAAALSRCGKWIFGRQCDRPAGHDGYHHLPAQTLPFGYGSLDATEAVDSEFDGEFERIRSLRGQTHEQANSGRSQITPEGGFCPSLNAQRVGREGGLSDPRSGPRSECLSPGVTARDAIRESDRAAKGSCEVPRDRLR